MPGTERGTPSVRAAEVHELPPLEELLGSPPLDVPPVPPLDPPADVPDDGPADSSEGPEGGRGAAA